MKTRYLKCTYGKGLFKEEYLINFNSANQNWCSVNKTDIIPLDEKNGYVKCQLASKQEREAIIVINDVGDHRQSSFRVNISDLVLKAKAA